MDGWMEVCRSWVVYFVKCYSTGDRYIERMQFPTSLHPYNGCFTSVILFVQLRTINNWQ